MSTLWDSLSFPNGWLDQPASLLTDIRRWIFWRSVSILCSMVIMTDNHPGAGTGGATKSILRHIGQDFSSYTFTDISNGFFDKAQALFDGFRSRMAFRALDIEKDVLSQGFQEHSYDLIVASFVIHATSKLEQTMRNVRRLLKPGGFVLMAEVTNNDQIRGGFIFGALPGWWVGIHEGRVLSPCVSPTKWDSILRKTGFSGIDMITPDVDNMPYPGSVFISQAVDDRVAFLRQPLSPPPSLFRNQSIVPDLHIVGGITLRVSRLVSELSAVLRTFCGRISVAETLEEMDYSLVAPGSLVLSLTELDKPVFKALTPKRFQSLKQLFGSEKTLLWVTEGRRADNPYSNMTVGFGRSLLWEVPDLRLQFLDLENVGKLDCRVLAEALLRFHVEGSWAREESRKLLWSVEPEIAIDSDGRQIIPRLHAMDEANDRYNSARRLITRDVNPHESAVAIARAGNGSISLKEHTQVYSTYDIAYDILRLRVTHSVLQAIQTPIGRVFVALAVDSSGTKYFTLTSSPISILEVSPEIAIQYSPPHSTETQLLLAIASNLVCARILERAEKGKTLLVHNAPPLIADTLARRASGTDVTVVYSTSLTNPHDASWIYIDQYMPQRTAKALLPNNIASFVDFSTDEFEKAQIESCLPTSCRRENMDSLLSIEAADIASFSNSLARDTLEKALSLAQQDLELGNLTTEDQAINVQDLTSEFAQKEPLAVIDWNENASLPVNVVPVDSQALFKPDRTYWLVGLTGSLGLSLCDWMIEHGAKYVVLSSRNPKVDPAWFRATEQKGAVVKIFPK